LAHLGSSWVAGSPRRWSASAGLAPGRRAEWAGPASLGRADDDRRAGAPCGLGDTCDRAACVEIDRRDPSQRVRLQEELGEHGEICVGVLAEQRADGSGVRLDVMGRWLELCEQDAERARHAVPLLHAGPSHAGPAHAGTS
jgi:hypothetical protein